MFLQTLVAMVSCDTHYNIGGGKWMLRKNFERWGVQIIRLPKNASVLPNFVYNSLKINSGIEKYIDDKR